jgi:hypothetical protein
MPTRKTTEPKLTPRTDESTNPLLRGRACYERRQWHDAFEPMIHGVGREAARIAEAIRLRQRGGSTVAAAARA